MSDWTGNSNSIYKTLGASNHTDKEREKDDYYATEPKALELLLDEVELNKNVWECSCGEGHLSEVLKVRGYNVVSTDLVDRGYGTGNVDFLLTKGTYDGDILTNPPYKYAQEFIEHALEIIPEGNRVFMFLKIQFLEGKKRRRLFDKRELKNVYVASGRLLCAKNGEFEAMKIGGGSAVAYAWYEFEKGYKGNPVIKWIN